MSIVNVAAANQQEIIKDLPAFSFDAAACQVDKENLHLRKRSYIMTCNVIAHGTFFVGLFNEIKKRICQLNCVKNLTRLKVGVIGCGRMGSHFVRCLIEYANIIPEDIFVSVRRQGGLALEFKDQGVQCSFSNKAVASSVDILLLCVTSSQLEEILHEIKGNIKCCLYSIIVGLSASKIRYLLKYDLVYKPSYEYNFKELEEYELSTICSIKQALASKEVQEFICPVFNKNASTMIKTDFSFIAFLVFVALKEHILPEEETTLESGNVDLVVKVKCLLSVIYVQLVDIDGLANDICGWISEIENFRASNIRDFERLECVIKKQESDLYKGHENRFKAMFGRFREWNDF